MESGSLLMSNALRSSLLLVLPHLGKIRISSNLLLGYSALKLTFNFSAAAILFGNSVSRMPSYYLLNPDQGDRLEELHILFESKSTATATANFHIHWNGSIDLSESFATHEPKVGCTIVPFAGSSFS